MDLLKQNIGLVLSQTEKIKQLEASLNHSQNNPKPPDSKKSKRKKPNKKFRGNYKNRLKRNHNRKRSRNKKPR